MTATQSLKLFEISKRYFQNDNDVRSFLEEIENVVDDKFILEKQNLVNKPELVDLQNEVKLLRKNMQIGFADMKAEMRAEFNKIVIWFISTMFAMVALLYTIFKIFEK